VSPAADDDRLAISALPPKLSAAMYQPTHQKKRSAQNALLLILLIAGCSKSPTPPSEPLVTAPPAPATQGDISATAVFNSVPSKYVGHLQDGRLQTIDEERTTADGAAAHGEYSFYEARLMKYRGAALTSQGTIELEFNLHGALTKSHSANGALVTAGEISAIRNRAQLLRSHALAARDTKMHRTS
jgi:hypothetical protein